MQRVAISRSSLVGRIYEYWESMGGNPPEQLDICFIRSVVMFRAPFAFFFRHQIAGWLRPWMVLLFTTAVVGITLLTVKLPKVLILILEVVGLVLLVIVAACAAIAAIAFLTILWQDHIEPAASVWWGNWWPNSQLNKAWTWFWTKNLRFYVYPWMAVGLASFGTLCYFYPTMLTFGVLAVYLFFAVLVFTIAAEDSLHFWEHTEDWVIPGIMVTGNAVEHAGSAIERKALGGLETLALMYESLKNRFCVPVVLVNGEKK